jgi:hypothetical protein
MYAAERHVFARSSYDAGMRFLLQGDKVHLDAASRAKVARSLGWTTHSALVVEGYGTAGKHEATHRTMMILKHFDPPLYRLMLGDFVKYLRTWTPDYQHSAWLITGSAWQPGLVKIAENLGKDAGPLVAGLKDCLETKTDKASKNKAHVACREKLRQAVEDYEKKHGR